MRRALLLSLAVLLSGLLWLVWGLPSRGAVRELARVNPSRTAVMRQREDEAQRAGRKPRHAQSWVPLSRVSRHLIHGVIAAEDQKFFGHEGVDWDAVKQSVEANRQAGRFARGGSTITQQLAKNLFFSTHKSLARKVRELVAAYWLEQDLSKVRILELYLNVIEWGDGVYGCQAAALQYYGKPASSLDESEAAGLVAMIPNPRRINPRVNAARHARATRRVLWLMAHGGYIRRELGGLGSEPPPPEPVEEDEEPPPLAPEATPSAEPVIEPTLEPTGPPTPEPSIEPTLPPAETPPPTPEPTPTPTTPP
ncbi:MAG TPA: monofunctional biosynthetic peptidoglycan transglycosylase [Vicinamibacteria bacterium]